MQSNPIEEIPEEGDAYWSQRVVTLEVLVAELLAKNQTMRFSLQTLEQQKPMAKGGHRHEVLGTSTSECSGLCKQRSMAH